MTDMFIYYIHSDVKKKMSHSENNLKIRFLMDYKLLKINELEWIALYCLNH